VLQAVASHLYLLTKSLHWQYHQTSSLGINRVIRSTSCMWNVEVNGEYPQHPGCVPPSMYPEDPGTVVARSCRQRRVDEKIWDASPIWDSANPEAEIDRSGNMIAWRQTCTCCRDLDTRIWRKNQWSTTENMADVI